MNGVDFYGIGPMEPDVHFVPATTKLSPTIGERLATIPLLIFSGITQRGARPRSPGSS